MKRGLLTFCGVGAALVLVLLFWGSRWGPPPPSPEEGEAKPSAGRDDEGPSGARPDPTVLGSGPDGSHAPPHASFEEALERLRSPTPRGPRGDGSNEAITAFAALLERDPSKLADVETLLSTETTDLELAKRLVVALGRTRLPRAHDLLIGLFRDRDARRLLRSTAVVALGQKRGRVERGKFVFLSGDVAFGYPIREPELLDKLVAVYRDGLRDPEDGARNVLRSRLAHVLSGNIFDPRVVVALGESLDSAGQGELDSALHALTAAKPEHLKAFVPKFQRILSKTREGALLGYAAALLLKSSGVGAGPEVEAVFREWLARAPVDRAIRSDLAAAIADLTSSLKLQPHLHAWLRGFASSLLAGGAVDPGSELGSVLLVALATAADEDLASSAAKRVLSVLSDPETDGAKRCRLVLAIGPYRLSEGGATRLMEAILKGGATLGRSHLSTMGSALATATCIGDEQLEEWAWKLDTLVGAGGSFAQAVRRSRKGTERHEREPSGSRRR